MLCTIYTYVCTCIMYVEYTHLNIRYSFIFDVSGGNECGVHSRQKANMVDRVNELMGGTC